MNSLGIKYCLYLRAVDTRKPFQKVIYRRAVSQILKQCRDRYSRATKHPHTANTVRFSIDGATLFPGTHDLPLYQQPGRFLAVATISLASRVSTLNANILVEPNPGRPHQMSLRRPGAVERQRLYLSATRRTRSSRVLTVSLVVPKLLRGNGFGQRGSTVATLFQKPLARYWHTSAPVKSKKPLNGGAGEPSRRTRTSRTWGRMGDQFGRAILLSTLREWPSQRGEF